GQPTYGFQQTAFSLQCFSLPINGKSIVTYEINRNANSYFSFGIPGVIPLFFILLQHHSCSAELQPAPTEFFLVHPFVRNYKLQSINIKIKGSIYIAYCKKRNSLFYLRVYF